MNKIIIDGKVFEVAGNNINVQSNGGVSTISVNGSTITTTTNSVVKVIFQGDLANLDCHNAEINGNVTGNVDGHNVHCKGIGGNVHAHNVFNN